MIQATVMRYRAQAVAADIIDTSKRRSEFATEQEINDPDFCAELDALISCCEHCDWWHEASEPCDAPGCDSSEGCC